MNGDCDINFSSMIDTRMEKIHEKSLEQDTEELLSQSDDKYEDENEENFEGKNEEEDEKLNEEHNSDEKNEEENETVRPSRRARKKASYTVIQCEHCPEVCANDDDYAMHIRAEHSLQCERCTYITESQKKLNIHIKKRHAKELANWKNPPKVAKMELTPDDYVKLPEPEVSEITSEILPENNEKKQNPDMEKVKCSQCSLILLKKSLLRHIRLVHMKNKFTCKICKEKFPTLKSRNDHVEKIHENPSQNGENSQISQITSQLLQENMEQGRAGQMVKVKCPQCDLIMLKKSLLRHTRKAHMNNQTSDCESQESVKSEHLLKCELCEYSTMFPKKFSFHMEKRHAKRLAGILTNPQPQRVIPIRPHALPPQPHRFFPPRQSSPGFFPPHMPPRDFYPPHTPPGIYPPHVSPPDLYPTHGPPRFFPPHPRFFPPNTPPPGFPPGFPPHMAPPGFFPPHTPPPGFFPPTGMETSPPTTPDFYPPQAPHLGGFPQNIQEPPVEHDKIPCQFCDQTFPLQSDLRSHHLEAHQNKKFLCKAPGCNVGFSKLTILRQHSITVHGFDIDKSDTDGFMETPDAAAFSALIEQQRQEKIRMMYNNNYSQTTTTYLTLYLCADCEFQSLNCEELFFHHDSYHPD